MGLGISRRQDQGWQNVYQAAVCLFGAVAVYSVRDTHWSLYVFVAVFAVFAVWNAVLAVRSFRSAQALKRRLDGVMEER